MAGTPGALGPAHAIALVDPLTNRTRRAPAAARACVARLNARGSQSSVSPAVTTSIRRLSAGPAARHVNVPGGTWRGTIGCAGFRMMSSGRCGGRPFPHSVSRDVEALLTREDIGLRERTLWRLLYENAARSASSRARMRRSR
jgi:hypothetical protein